MSRAECTIVSLSPEQTRSIGYELGRQLRQTFADAIAPSGRTDLSIVLTLSGNLGAGKTTLTQGVAAGLGIAESVTSPTFTLVREYELPSGNPQQPFTLFHVDAYRLGDNPEVDAATFGLEEIVETSNSLIIVEWAERLESILPLERIEIEIDYVDDGEDTDENTVVADPPQVRSLTIKAADELASAVLDLGSLGMKRSSDEE